MPFWHELFSLTSQTVELIPLEEEHVEELWEIAKAPEIWSYMATQIHTKEALRTSLQSALKDRDKGLQYPFSVFHKQQQRIVGSTRWLDLSEANRSAEIGWTWYDPAVWRTSVNTECKWLLLQHAFESWDLNRVQLKTDLRNIRSQKAIERIGGVREGVLRKDRILSSGMPRNTVCYSIIDEEWPQVKQNLLSRMTDAQ
ncbi:GNAT family N-acetyltransferase [Cytobacillus spongiae]|jgi:RimJ/RimL family protein N-acetyltransferase|uniref:GNAT family N-acetyltransferase n=1 Tax=Cytobacillus spongiae TaxID=2901381 RepID=UPI001F2F6E39|nr:GNAT family protein [Cytobacillus spongiae]UII54306.1 GNAT family N-acetyltransferase [Cytobacillus spongiae]